MTSEHPTGRKKRQLGEKKVEGIRIEALALWRKMRERLQETNRVGERERELRFAHWASCTWKDVPSHIAG